MLKSNLIFAFFVSATLILGTYEVSKQIENHKTQDFVRYKETETGPKVLNTFKSSISKVQARPFDGTLVEPDIKFHTMSGCGLPQQPGPTPTPGPIPNQPPQVTDWSVVQVHAQNLGMTGKGIKVCVLDTGSDLRHPDLKITKAISEVDSDPQDYFGHGSHVAGIIAAQNNEIGTVGIAPDAEIYSIKVLDNNGSGSLSGIAKGVDDSVNQFGCDIISMSLGGGSGSQLLFSALQNAASKGIWIAVAAGNENSFTSFPAQYQIPGLWSVAALDKQNKKASFSNYGKVEISAPGVDMLAPTPVGYKTPMGDGSGYSKASGTSMATPIVAGIMALAKQAKKELKAIPIGDAQYFGIGQADAELSIK